MKNLLNRFSTEDRWVALSLASTLGGIIIGALYAEPRAAGGTALVGIGILLIAWKVTKSPRLSWLLLFGLVTGILELWTDLLHVIYFQSVVYENYFGFKLLASPSYMPLLYWLVIVQFGYLGVRLSESWASWSAVGLVTGLGIAMSPWYEELSFNANFWYYRPSEWMLWHTPVWIIFTYGSCAFSIVTLAVEFYRPRAWERAVLAGLFAAASIMFSSVFWYALLGKS